MRTRSVSSARVILICELGRYGVNKVHLYRYFKPYVREVYHMYIHTYIAP